MTPAQLSDEDPRVGRVAGIAFGSIGEIPRGPSRSLTRTNPLPPPSPGLFALLASLLFLLIRRSRRGRVPQFEIIPSRNASVASTIQATAKEAEAAAAVLRSERVRRDDDDEEIATRQQRRRSRRRWSNGETAVRLPPALHEPRTPVKSATSNLFKRLSQTGSGIFKRNSAGAFEADGQASRGRHRTDENEARRGGGGGGDAGGGAGGQGSQQPAQSSPEDATGASVHSSPAPAGDELSPTVEEAGFVYITTVLEQPKKVNSRAARTGSPPGSVHQVSEHGSPGRANSHNARQTRSTGSEQSKSTVGQANAAGRDISSASSSPSSDGEERGAPSPIPRTSS